MHCIDTHTYYAYSEVFTAWRYQPTEPHARHSTSIHTHIHSFNVSPHYRTSTLRTPKASPAHVTTILPPHMLPPRGPRTPRLLGDEGWTDGT
mmetsp:Transcript_27237/g.67947  ORF Transcript_27237/g.67947 Transcript_27237/m.67947 type:complete len:92 (+) Transcript_27237:2366-2641(+)